MSEENVVTFAEPTQAFGFEAAMEGALERLLQVSLDVAVAAMSEDCALEERVENAGGWEDAFLRHVRGRVDYALASRDARVLGEMHRALFLLYELQVVDGAKVRAVNQFNPTLVRMRSAIERAWLANETRRAGGGGHTSTPVVERLKALWANHAVASHPIFDFLETDATRAQILAFFRSDSALNIRFFDLLVYSMIGSREGVRGELAQNFWDESGRGVPARSHVTLFQRLLEVVGVGRAADHHASALEWQGLAGYNLFMLACVNRQHYFKLLGIMAMTELLDPSQYEKLARGCRRVGLGGEEELAYYDEHVTIDVIHGEGWLANVIAPIVAESPEVADDIVLGAALRLHTCSEYYDDLFASLQAF